MLPTADICDNFPTKVLVVKPIFKDFGGKTAFYGKAITLKTHDDNTKVKKALESNGGNNSKFTRTCAPLGQTHSVRIVGEILQKKRARQHCPRLPHSRS